MRLLCNGYAESEAGSVSSASYLVLKELLLRGHNVRFFGKPSFVFPTDLRSQFSHFELVDVTNRFTERLDEKLGKMLGPVKVVTGSLNHNGFLSGVVCAMERAASKEPADAALFFGLVPPRNIKGVRTIGWAQGPPGSDARSIRRHFRQLSQTEGLVRTSALAAYGWIRTSFCQPAFAGIDHLVVGSSWSRNRFINVHTVSAERVTAVAYPIDPALFVVRDAGLVDPLGPLNVLWLGRIVPRKRLDLFIAGIELAMSRGVNIAACIVGGFGFAGGLRRLLVESSAKRAITYTPTIPRHETVHRLRQADVLCQPSDDEDFGSSVAEAQMCGTPVIVGHTNGTGDYICPKSIQLADDTPATLADAFEVMWTRKQRGELLDVPLTRRHAEAQYDVRRIVDQLEVICKGQS